ncbi:MAG: hypothetical protein SFW67_13090 [Myxococcaceae bacterium]|nr:hypothetical protein [Myxococcaceae bacterium]
MLAREGVTLFSRSDFLSFDVKNGVLRSPAGTRMLAVNDDFLRGFVSALDYEAGEAASLILRKCGTFFGRRLAQRFEAEVSQWSQTPLRDRPMSEYAGLMADLFKGCGLGAVDVDFSNGDRGFLSVKLVNSPMQDLGPRGHVGDDLFCGLFEGFFTHFTDTGLGCLQTGDVRLGNREGTTFVLGFEEVIARAKDLLAQKQPHSAIVAALGS